MKISEIMVEGDGRKKGIHGKGHPMRKKQQAAIHANEDTAEAYTPTKDKNDYDAKAKVLQSIQLDPATSKDPELRKELIKRKKALEKDKAKLKETVFIDKMKSFIVENYELENFTEAMTKIASTSEIYVDMDGVLADFFGDWAKLMGVDSFRDIKDAGPALAKIRATDDFWLKLPLLPEAKKLLSLIKEVKGEYNICTSPLANDPNSEPHKREWIKKNLAFFPPKNIHITHDKPQFATAKDSTPNILIDDYGVNINAWEAAGGIGFKHKDHKFERTANEIKQHMQKGKQQYVIK